MCPSRFLLSIFFLEGGDKSSHTSASVNLVASAPQLDEGRGEGKYLRGRVGKRGRGGKRGRVGKRERKREGMVCLLEARGWRASITLFGYNRRAPVVAKN